MQSDAKKQHNPLERKSFVIVLYSPFFTNVQCPEINHGKVAAVKTDALETEIELRVEFRAKIKVKKTSAG